MFNKQLVVPKELQGFINMFYMGILGFTLNMEIIKEHTHKILEEWLKNIDHWDLKGRWGIAKSKWYH